MNIETINSIEIFYNVFINFLENEFEKLKVFCDYLMFDQFSERLTYPRFVECISVLAESQKFNLNKIFMELCGKHKKYLNFARLLSAYVNLNSKESSSELKNFFNYFMNSVIKDPSQIAGKEVPNAKQYSTISHKNREFIDKIEIYTDSSNKIKGLSVEYDDLFKNEFIVDDVNHVDTSISKRFSTWNDLHNSNKKLKKKVCLNLRNLEHFNDEDLPEEHLRDFVTHIYGTYTERIELLGFKTSSGKMYYTGNPKQGTPFLFGKFHQKFHYFKLGMKDGGISYIKPYFVPSVFCNYNLDIDYDIFINNDFEFELGINQYDDETLLEKIVDEKLYLSQILTPFFEDNLLYKDDAEDRFDRKLRQQFTSFQNRLSINKIDVVNGRNTLKETISDENYDNEENRIFKSKYHEIIHTEGGLSPDNLIDPYCYDDEDDFYEDLDEIERKEYEEIEALEWEMEKIEKSNQLNLYKKTYLNKWDGVSVKTLDVPILFSDPFSLERFADRYFNELQYEIDNKITKINEYLNPDNFYCKFFLYDNCCMHKYESELFDDNYIDELYKIKDQFDGIVLKFTGKDGNLSPKRFTEQNKLNILKSITHKLIDQRTLVRKWNRFTFHFKKRLSISAIKNAVAVQTAKKILLNCENNFMDKSYSLIDKIKILNILTELKPKKTDDQPIKLLEIEYVKKGIQSHIRNILYKRKEDKKIKEKERRKQEEEKRKLLEIIIQEGKRKKKAESKEEFEKINDIELQREEAAKGNQERYNEVDRKRDEEAKTLQDNENKPLVDKHLTIYTINMIYRNIAFIQRLIREGKLKNETEKNNLSEQLEAMKKKKMNMTRYLLEFNKKKISDQVDINLDDLKLQESEKRKKIIEEEITRVLAEKENQDNLNKKKLKKPIAFSELDIPATTEIFREQHIIKGKEFTDDLFPPTIQSLCPFDEKNQSWILPLEIEPDDLFNWNRFSWARIDQIFRSEDYQIFVKNIEPADIIQGSLGDCYFLSAIAALCKFPELIKRLFLFKEKSIDRCYGIHLRKNGIWKLVLLDDFVPCYGGFRKKFAFSSANENEMWVVLLEKAWAKISGSYAKVIAGQSWEVFDAITNAPTEIIWIHHISKDLLFNKLIEGKSNEFIMTAGTGNRISMEEYEKVNLEPGHAFTILDIIEVLEGNTKTNLLKIRNPWGVGEWSGNWGDKSNLWTPALIKQVGLEDKDDGVFFMSFEDFIKYFIVVNICRIHKNYNYSFVKYKKTEVSKPNVLCLELETDGNVYLQMHQKNPRYLLKNGKYPDPILIHMMVVDEQMNYIAASCDDTSSIFLNMNLKAGTYYVYTDINHRYVNNHDMHGYNITTYSSCLVSLENDTEMDAMEVCKKGVISYCKSILKSQRKEDLLYYSPNNIIPEFPYIFVVLENVGTKTTEVTFELTHSKESSFFSEDNLSLKKLSKKIESNMTEIFYIIRHKLDSSLQYCWNSKKL